MSCNLYTDKDFFKHSNGPGHPECQERLAELLERVKTVPNLNIIRQVEPAADDVLELCHSPEYLRLVEDSEPQEEGQYAVIEKRRPGEEFPSTLLSCGSVVAAKKAVGACCLAVDDIKAGKASTAFCAVRPPGHHADSLGAFGFCIFSNVAIAAKYAVEKGFKRVAIFDHDVHHGNGTEEFVKDSENIIFASMYERLMWPEHLATENVPHKSGRNCLKIPVSTEAAAAEYVECFERYVVPFIGDFSPDLILISSGFDSHAKEREVERSEHNDPPGRLCLEDRHFAFFVEKLGAICPNIVCVLEGGYNIPSLASAATAQVIALTTL